MKEDVSPFKAALEDELKTLEEELRSIGRPNPDNPTDWEATPGGLDASPSDQNEVADTIEEFEGNTAVLKQLEIRYNEVRGALSRIAAGNYGVCEISGEPVEHERLLANPAARTCIAHRDREHELR